METLAVGLPVLERGLQADGVVGVEAPADAVELPVLVEDRAGRQGAVRPPPQPFTGALAVLETIAELPLLVGFAPGGLGRHQGWTLGYRGHAAACYPPPPRTQPIKDEGSARAKVGRPPSRKPR